MKKLIYFVVMVVFLGSLFAWDAAFQRLTADEYFNLIKQMKQEETEFVLLDVRTLPEYEIGHIEDAQMLDFHSKEFVTELNKLDKSKLYLIYCRSGNRTGSHQML